MFHFVVDEKRSDTRQANEPKELGAGHNRRALAFPEGHINLSNLFQGPIGQLFKLINYRPWEIKVNLKSSSLLCLFGSRSREVSHRSNYSYSIINLFFYKCTFTTNWIIFTFYIFNGFIDIAPSIKCFARFFSGNKIWYFDSLQSNII